MMSAILSFFVNFEPLHLFFNLISQRFAITAKKFHEMYFVNSVQCRKKTAISFLGKTIYSTGLRPLSGPLPKTGIYREIFPKENT